MPMVRVSNGGTDLAPLLVAQASLSPGNPATRALNYTFEVGAWYAILFAFRWDAGCTFSPGSYLENYATSKVATDQNCYGMVYVGQAKTTTMYATVNYNISVSYGIIKLSDN